MTERLRGVDLPRPEAAADQGPLDTRFYDLVEARVRRLFEDNPVFASLFGIHTEDHRLGDATRDAVLQEIADDRAHLAAIEALDADALSANARFERDLEIHNLRLALFEADDVRSWERAGTAAGVIGDALFLLFARGAKPLAERLERITDRIEAVPAFLDGSRSRVVGTPVRIWQEVEARYAADLPGLFGDVLATAETTLAPAEVARMRRAIATANTCLDDYGGWLRDGLAQATDDWPLGGEPYDELVRLRAFGDLDTDTILRIGEEQLATSLEARRTAARELDPDADVHTVIDRLKSDHPATFGEALDGYRDVMRRARAHILERGIATIPPDEHVEVIATPEYLRTVMPFAAYYEPARFDDDNLALYIVTPDVDGDPERDA